MIKNLNLKDSLKIIQITDTHLFSENKLLFGVDSNKAFDRVLQHISKNQINNTDLIFLTGDISQDETAESYNYLLTALSRFNTPVILIPGNHDDTFKMDKVFSNSSLFLSVNKLELKHWLFIFLNTQLENEIKGSIKDIDFDLINEEINYANATNKKIALVMHHHPAPVSTPLIDQYILRNHYELWKCIENTNVSLIVFGHVHNAYKFKFKNINIESAPATCFQFPKGSTSLCVENKIGYKIHCFEKNMHFSQSVILDNENEIS